MYWLPELTEPPRPVRRQTGRPLRRSAPASSHRSAVASSGSCWTAASDNGLLYELIAAEIVPLPAAEKRSAPLL